MRILIIGVTSTLLLSWSYATPIGEYRPLRASYSIYSGTPGEKEGPTKTDRKIAIAIEGQAAKDIFDSLYPDVKVTCSEEKGERLRRKGELWCSYTPSRQYRCFAGFNLRTGESYSGASC